MMITTFKISVVGFLGLMLVPTMAMAERPAMSSVARQHLTAGLEHYAAENYGEAVTEFELGYAIDPHPDLLFARAQAHRLAGDCGLAMGVYAKFLASDPSDAQRDATLTAMERCQEQPKPEPQVAPMAVPASAPPAEPDRDVRWYHDLAGDALLGGGVAGLAVSAALFAGSSPPGSAESATYGEYASDVEAARSRRTAAWITGGIGGALVGAALWRYSLVTRDSAGVSTAAAWCTEAGCTAAVGGTF